MENGDIHIKQRPDLARMFFWEYDYDRIDWQVEAVSIIARIIERGMVKDWEVLIDFYGRDRVVKAIVEEIKYLRDDIIEEACSYFDLKKETLKSYKRKQSMPRYWL